MTITNLEIAVNRKNYAIETMRYFAQQKDLDPVMATRAIENAFSVATKEITDLYLSGEEVSTNSFKSYMDELKKEFNKAYDTMWE